VRPETKICRKCQTPKDIEAFGKCSAASDKLQSYCQKCQNSYNQQRLTAHPEVRKEYNRRAYLKNREEQIEKAGAYQRAHAAASRPRINERERRRMATDVNAKLASYTRRRILLALHGKVKEHHTTHLLGCSIAELKSHLEKQFQLGMNWSNYGIGGWHIDHKRPCSSFDLTNTIQQRACFHYTNLQPLWAKDNISKRDKWEAANA
jgi:hypothetical protein